MVMALFGKKTEVPVNTEGAQPPAQSLDYAQLDSILNQREERLIEKFRAALPQPQVQPQQTPTQSAQETSTDAPIEPEEEARITRVAGKLYRDQVMPYANMLGQTIPALAFNQARSELQEGQRLILDRHKDEYNANISLADPTARAHPEVIRRAIYMVLGAHSDEIESLVVERMTKDDLPPHLQLPTAPASAATQEPTLSAKEQEFVSYFDSLGRSKGRRWDNTQYDYYKNIPRGTLADMVAAHKAAKQKEQK
jgi:hypothetical protein